jgi:GH25 family lysozyme M1 (1,4-beta-N-acetylmuramidase)
MAYNILGCDASHWQSKLNADKLKANNIRFTFVKAGEVWVTAKGKPAVDDHEHDRSIKELKRVGIPCGDYYYWHPSAGASLQVRQYAEIYNRTKPDLPPVIDIEDTDGYKPADVKRQLFAFIDGLRKVIDRPVIIYSRNGFIVNQIGDPVWSKDTMFWIARYAQTVGSLSPKIKENTIIWQFTDRMKLPGLPILDGNYWMKSDQEFNDFVSNVVQSEPPEEPTDPLPEPFFKQGKVIVSVLNVRNTPDWQNNMVVGKLRRGDIVDMSKVYNERWAEIEPGKYAAIRGESGTYIERII